MHLAAEFLQRVGVTGVRVEAHAEPREQVELLARAGEVFGPERWGDLVIHRTAHAPKMWSGPGMAP